MELILLSDIYLNFLVACLVSMCFCDFDNELKLFSPPKNVHSLLLVIWSTTNPGISSFKFYSWGVVFLFCCFVLFFDHKVSIDLEHRIMRRLICGYKLSWGVLSPAPIYTELSIWKSVLFILILWIYFLFKFTKGIYNWILIFISFQFDSQTWALDFFSSLLYPVQPQKWKLNIPRYRQSWVACLVVSPMSSFIVFNSL